MSAYTLVREPLTFGATTIKNRILVAPHGQSAAVDNAPSDRQIAYYEERAKGGVGMVGVGGSVATLRKGLLQRRISARDVRAIPMLARLADAVHAHDCRIVVQLGSAGVMDRARVDIDDWHAVQGPSRVKLQRVLPVFGVDLIVHRGALCGQADRVLDGTVMGLGARRVFRIHGAGLLLRNIFTMAHLSSVNEFTAMRLGDLARVANKRKRFLEKEERRKEGLPLILFRAALDPFANRPTSRA